MARDDPKGERSSSFVWDLLTVAFANRGVRWAAVIAIAAPLVFYLLEDLSIRARFPQTAPFGQITVHRYYALHKSREKMTLLNTEPQEEKCVHALFPHLGYAPCWYLSRHAEQRVDFQ